MTSSNLAILIFFVTVSVFVISYFARRPGPHQKKLQTVMTALGISVVVLTLIYFKRRLAGG